LLLGHLPAAVRGKVLVIDREIPVASQDLADAAQSVITAALAQETGDRLGRWRELLSHDGAVEGLAETVAALRDGVAGDVPCHPALDTQRPAWIGPGAEMAL